MLPVLFAACCALATAASQGGFHHFMRAGPPEVRTANTKALLGMSVKHIRARQRPNFRFRLPTDFATHEFGGHHRNGNEPAAKPRANRGMRKLALGGVATLQGLFAPPLSLAARATPPIIDDGPILRILGKTSSELFPIQLVAQTKASPFFALVLGLLITGWKYTPLFTLVPSLVFGVLYVVVLKHLVTHPISGWLHYCAFDCLIGLGIVLDAKNVGVPHLLCVPCLLLTMLAGPSGLLLYVLFRMIFSTKV
eukprot:jgi/Bigna1/85761/estExt_fgenesh1_pg.C_60035